MTIKELYTKYEKYTGVALTTVSIVSALFAVDAYYAKAEAVDKLEIRLEQKILNDRYDRVQERIWKLEDRFIAQEKAPVETKRSWRELQLERDDIHRKLDAIEQKVLEKKK